MKYSEKKIAFYGILAVIFILIILLLTYFCLGNQNNETRGTFGDMFGAANSLFTGLSAVGLLITILLQRKDINTQRQELNKQNNAIQIQNFESTFFQMMNILFKVMEEIHYYEEDRKLSGRSAISMIHYSIVTKTRIYCAKKEGRNIDSSQVIFNVNHDEIKNILDHVFSSQKNQLSSYYRTIFNIVKMIDENPFINKIRFVNILTSQLSRMEIMMLYYYGLLDGNDSEKNLIEKYSMLKDIDISNILFFNLKSDYNKNAFGN